MFEPQPFLPSRLLPWPSSSPVAVLRSPGNETLAAAYYLQASKQGSPQATLGGGGASGA